MMDSEENVFVLSVFLLVSVGTCPEQASACACVCVCVCV